MIIAFKAIITVVTAMNNFINATVNATITTTTTNKNFIAFANTKNIYRCYSFWLVLESLPPMIRLCSMSCDLAFEGEVTPYKFTSISKSDRNAWVQALTTASYECLRMELQSLREELQACTGYDPVTFPGSFSYPSLDCSPGLWIVSRIIDCLFPLVPFSVFRYNEMLFVVLLPRMIIGSMVFL